MGVVNQTRFIPGVLSVLLHAAVFGLLQFGLTEARTPAAPEIVPVEIVKAPETEPPKPVPSPDAIAPAPETENTPLPTPPTVPESSAPASPLRAPGAPTPERFAMAPKLPWEAPPAPVLPPLPAPPIAAPAPPEPEAAKREPPHSGTEVDEDAAPDLKDKTKVVGRWILDPLKLDAGHRCGTARLTAILHLTEEKDGVFLGLLSRRIAWDRCKPETALYSVELRLEGASAVLTGRDFRDQGRHENGVMYLTDAYGSSVWRKK